jgi:hypothetical protein
MHLRIPHCTLALACFLLFVAFGELSAQTETVLYSFQGSNVNPPDGVSPQSRLTFDSAGNLYGLTGAGGLYGAGTVYELSRNAAGNDVEHVLYNFTGGVDGGGYGECLGTDVCNSYLIFDGAGNLYGTMGGGGAYNWGVVFELSPHTGPTGTTWTESVLHSFTGSSDGLAPTNGLVMDKSGNLYGVTESDFYQRETPGTVYKLAPSRGTWTLHTI